MDVNELEVLTGQAITDAATFADDDIGPQRAEATNYYRGEPFGNEEEGRSSVVSRDVADTVNAILPSLMRVFTGPENVVEFVPQGQEDVQAAEQATDYVNYVFMRDNPGFEILYSTFKDALVRKCGIVKYWWDESEEVTTQEYSGLDEMGLNKLHEDLSKAQSAEIIEQEQDDNGALSVTIKLTRRKDRVCVVAVPPEEFLIDRRARTIDDAAFVGHRCWKTVSDLVAMGYDEEEVRAHTQLEIETNEEALARNPFLSSPGAETEQLVLYVEGYIRADVDEDGIAELVKVCTIGSSYSLLHHEAVESRNFAAFHCDPEPHTFYGQSAADKVTDVQRVKSALLRNALDALSLSLNPRMIVVNGDGNIADAMNPEIGAILRARTADGYQPITTPDVSPSAYQALTYMDQVKESRTGMNRVSQGLDPKALQNTTATAAAAQFTQSQQHIELIARIFAETGMKRLFRGILKLVSENQRQERMVQLRNRWVPVDPRAWRVDMDVTCNVALGGGTSQEKLQILAMVAEKQESIIQLMGPENPLVGLGELHNTYSQQLALAGFKNPDAFFKDPTTPEAQQMMAQKANQPPPPDPKVMEVQAKLQLEGQKAQAGMQMEQARFQHDQEKSSADFRLKQMQIAADAQLKREQMQLEIELKRQQLAEELQLKREQMAAEISLAERQASHKASLAEASLSDVRPGGEPG